MEVFFISDHHFGHQNILSFEDKGQRLRPFDSLLEMHVKMIESWNSKVGVRDVVYHLGDVAFSRDGLKLLGMLNGKKRLVRGNHDLFKTQDYREYFKDIYGVRQIDGYWLTHIPMHESCLDRAKLNIHGHLHLRTIDHPKYFNVCVEQLDYTPISWDEIKERQ